MQAQRAAHTAMAARDTKHAYVYADSSAAGGLLGATVPRADPDTEAAAEAAAAAAATLTPSGCAYPKPTPIAQKRRHAKAPQDAHSAAFREPYMDAAEQAARQREAERQQVLAVGGHRPGWGHAPMVGREFGYKNPATGEDESARFNTSVHAASHAAKQAEQQTARAEAEAWAQRVVVDAKQVKWRGHSTPHAAPGTADKYKPLLADAPATLALRAAHAAKTPSGKVHALYEDRLAVDTVHRDAGASQEHLHTSTQALHPAQPPHDAAKLAASASAGSLRDAGLRAISALAGQQGVMPLALSFRGRTPDGPSNASLTSGAGAGLTRRGAWASGLLKSPQLATATGLSPRRQTSGAGPFSPILTSQSRSAADVLHKPHIQPLPAALRSGPQWG
ncbi:unnamed protein product [Symbiodinium sp. KB8]|nr:unnamed protein product [Symbiodinium sp. KB8]